jgi:ATP-binding cassette subfamily C protein
MNRAEGGIAPLLHDYRTYAGARLWLAFVLMLLGAFAEGFGILALVPLAAVVIGGSAPNSHLGYLADWLPADNRLLAALILFVGAMGVRSLLLYWRERELADLQAGYEASLRLRAASTLAHRGWGFASGVGQGGMQALLLTDVPRSALAVAEAQHFATALVMLSVQLAIAALLSPALAIVAFAVLLAGVFLAVRWTRRSVSTGLALTERSGESTDSGFRLHAGLKAALAQGTVPQFLAEYGSSLNRQRTETVRFAVELTAARQLAALGAAVAAALILFVGFRLLHLPFAILVPALVLFARMVGPAQMLQHSAQYVGAYASAFVAIRGRLGGLIPATTDPRSADPLDWRELRFDGVSFHQPSGGGVDGLSTTVHRGEWLGVRGPSGSGKTTFVDLVAGLLAPQSGSLLVDGAPLDSLDRWRAGLAYVGQDGALFDDSVRGNLCADGVHVDESNLWDILSTVGLDQRIRALPGGLDERLGDRGSQLSGGERQRLAIARALLRKPSLLILDEATAALDPDGEAALLGALRAIQPRPAAIVVAHRESTLAHCDSVVSIQH